MSILTSPKSGRKKTNMKKILLAAVAVFAFGSASAQEGKFEAKVNPLGAIFGRPDLSAEYIVSENFGVELSLGLVFGTTGTATSVTSGGVTTTIDKPTQSGFGAKVNAKYYFAPKDEGADGWYGSIYLRQENYDVKYTGAAKLDYESSVFAGGLEFGKKWAFGSGFLIEAALGGGRPFSEKRTFTSGSDNASVELGFDVTGKFAIGYRFN